MQFIDLQKQYKLIEHQIKAGIHKVLEHGQYIMGPEIQTLESQLAEFAGVRHAIVNASGTDALFMALLALDLKPGDEVITTPFSFFATAEVIALCHAKPVFVDIDPETYNINASQIEAAITPRTKAIMPVSLYGQCADMNAINAIAVRHDLAVIEDAAQSFGALYHQKRSCSLSTIGCTSFFPSKPLGGYGDSGACFTDDDALAVALREIRVHGQRERYVHPRLGINGRMDSMQAAILIEKLALFEDEIALRSVVAERYRERLSNHVRTPILREGCTSVYAQYTIEVNQRSAFQQAMQEQGIPTAIHYPECLHLQESMKHYGYQAGDFPVAERAAARVISLPMHPYLTQEEQDSVAKAVLKSLQKIEAMA